MPVWAASFALAVVLCLLCGSGAEAASTGAMAWGGNNRGQVGNGTMSIGGCQCIPTAVPVSGLAGAVQISGGGESALALLADGTVIGWGDDFYGQLGDGASGAAPVPHVATRLPRNVVDVDVGRGHSLALLADGTVLAWGAADQGQLGVPPTGLEVCGLSTCRKTPTAVPGLAGAIAISTSESSNLALLADGTVMAWGDDQFGQVGDGTGVDSGCRCVATPVVVPGVRGAVAISSSTEGGAALLADGSVVDWGTNIQGQIGNGTVASGGCFCAGPTAVSGLAGVKVLTGGSRFRLALLGDGSLWGWGANNIGQFGTGAPSPGAPVPTAAAALTSPRSVSSSSTSTLALLDSGAVAAWGRNEQGQVGDGTTIERDAPQAVADVAGASSVAGHGTTSYALIGPSQSLTVALAGAGSGSVGTNGLLCSGPCSVKFPQSQTKVLRADSASAGFAGWSGPCSGIGPCQVRLDADQTVTATFGPPAGTAITATTIKSRKKKATLSFTAPGAITGYQCRLIKPRAKKGHGKKGKKKARPAKFTACATPRAYKHLKPGRYRFEVRALDILGADANPAVKKFTIKKAKKKHPKPKRSQQR